MVAGVMVGKSLCAASSARLATGLLRELYRGARHGAIGTKDTAIACLWP